jgi:hypothetical protein
MSWKRYMKAEGKEMNVLYLDRHSVQMSRKRKRDVEGTSAAMVLLKKPLRSY